jgi:hypothetical protein
MPATAFVTRCGPCRGEQGRGLAEVDDAALLVSTHFAIPADVALHP